jgi:hypothetical protein
VRSWVDNATHSCRSLLLVSFVRFRRTAFALKAPHLHPIGQQLASGMGDFLLASCAGKSVPSAFELCTIRQLLHP